ncbi:MAG: hypothetical protein R6W91_02990 [Thermoplasmata archaeon]
MNGPYPCQRCGMPLRWVEQYSQWWCDNCQIYAGYQTDEQRLSSAITGFGQALDRELGGSQLCGRCGRYARWVPEYRRWYCDGCMSYL